MAINAPPGPVIAADHFLHDSTNALIFAYLRRPVTTMSVNNEANMSLWTGYESTCSINLGTRLPSTATFLAILVAHLLIVSLAMCSDLSLKDG